MVNTNIAKLADVIVPPVFTQYTIQRTMEMSNLVSSGIVQNTALYDTLASGPNTLIDMPFFNDLTGEAETIVEDNFLTPDKITTSQDAAKKIGRAKAWGANMLSAFLSGADPLNAIGQLVASYWTREMQQTLLALLSGVFASPSMAAKIHDISGSTGDAGLFSGKTFVDANQVMGDAKDAITGVMMHSAVHAFLVKQQLIDFIQPAGQTMGIPTYMGKRVIIDDAMPFDTATGIVTLYLFGAGAIALGNGTHPRIVQTETDRDKLSSAGEDYLITRRAFILHPHGVRFMNAAVANQFPTNAELATAANWQLVYEPKAVRIVKFVCRIEV